MTNKLILDGLSGLKDDQCYINTNNTDSMGPGKYQLSGYDNSYHNVNNYTSRLSNRTHYERVIADNTDYTDQESDLWFSKLSNLRNLHQLYTRPYAGFFCGAGMPASFNKDVESSLMQGLLTNPRQHTYEPYRGESMYRYQYLPDYGNPQKEEHIIPVYWVRGGDNTRDYVRRVDYQQRCKDMKQTPIKHWVPETRESLKVNYL